MSTSGTYAFSPNLGDLVINAFAKCGVRRTDLTNQHMSDARMEANLMMSDWAGDGINLWQVQSASFPLTQGTQSYAIPSDRVFILDVYIRQDGFDRLIFPISRSDYASFAQKDLQGYPTSFWYDRLIDPNMYIWPVADQNGQYTLTYYYMRQAMDSELSNGTQPEVPWYYLNAFADGLAARLAYIYAPERVAVLQPKYDKSWFRALQVGSENVPINLNVAMRGYFR
jgi:hypothetical protein